MQKWESLKTVKIILALFATALFLSGLTALPLRIELSILNSLLGQGTQVESVFPSFSSWISLVNAAIVFISEEYPFLAYGYDWMAFGHFVIAIAFVGAVIDPVKRIWVIEFGVIACILVIPYSFIVGTLRDIPVFWRFIDSLFGFFGLIPLLLARKIILNLDEKERN